MARITIKEAVKITPISESTASARHQIRQGILWKKTNVADGELIPLNSFVCMVN